MGLIRQVTTAEAGRFIDSRLSGIERKGFRGKEALARLVRQGNIAAGFGVREFDGPAEVAAAAISRVSAFEVVLIKAGTFPVAGSQLFGNNKPAVENITMSGFYAGKYPVTVAEFRAFVEATGYEIAGEGAKELKELLADRTKDRHPIVFVNQADKEACTAWRSKTTGENWFILSAAQQEYMRRGAEGRTYLWGNNWMNPPYFNTGQTAAVDAWPQGATPEGVSGLGIVCEATSSYYKDYDPEIVEDPKGPEISRYIEVRGGSAWDDEQDGFNGAFRGIVDPSGRDYGIGFRLGRD